MGGRVGWGAERARRIAGAIAPAVALVGVQVVFFGLPLGAWIRGVVLGLLIALLAVGMALVYRANRVINFAQADLGFVPTSLAVGIIVFSGWPYLVGLGAGLGTAVVLGAVVEMAIVRRFTRSPRLVLTVATIGIAQLLVVGALLMPRLWDRSAGSQRIADPIDVTWTVGTFVLSGNDVIALVVAPLAMIAVALFLTHTRVGVAVRAAAERGERASMLGIPVSWLSTVVWSLAALLSFLALFLRAGILGIPLGSTLNAATLVLALGALVMGRLRNLPAIACAAVALGILEYGVAWNAESPLLVAPIVGLAILVSLLLQRRSTTRSADDATASWRATDEVRPVAPAYARRPEVRALRAVTLAAVAVGLAAVPVLLRSDQVIKSTAIVVYAIVGISLVVLTGWAGQVSLGQVGFVALGAAVSAKCTIEWQIDLSLALCVGGLTGAASAFVVGLPALRLRGLYLAVTTLAFALTVTSWLLNDRFFAWVPRERVDRLPLFGRIDLSSPSRYYAFSLVVLGLVMVAVRGVRSSRTGRAIVALRENERAAQAYAIPVTRLKLVAFTMSGAIAGIAGALLVHLTQSFDLATYGVNQSILVFTAAVIGGLGSLLGAVLGALYLRGTFWFVLDEEWRILSTAMGTLVVLLVLPGGLGSLWVRLRDRMVALVTGCRVDEVVLCPPGPSPSPAVEPAHDASDVADVADVAGVAQVVEVARPSAAHPVGAGD
jgi:branched-chain amino acid transport system permease protein